MKLEGPPPSKIIEDEAQDTIWRNWFRNLYNKVTNTTSGVVGEIIAKASNNVPDGFLECDGSAVNRITYANLFADIGETYGVGDGSTTFNLPDFRGEFLRGWDNSRGVDSGRAIASTQTDELKSHSHTQTLGGNLSTVANVAGSYVISDQNTSTTASTGGSETRPRNIAVMYCIKY